jgi:hypothetical protein
MAKQLNIEDLLKSGSKQWNQLRAENKVPLDHTGATFPQLFSANANLSGLTLIGTEWEKCDLSKVTFKDADLSNAYFHGGRLQDCDFRGANLAGATFEKLKLLRCDFSGAQGLDEVEFDDCDMDRVVGLDGEDAPPPPPPPAVGITSFTREQRAAAMAAQQSPENELPPFRPSDEPGKMLFRWLKHISNPPVWVLDVPNLRLPLPVRMATGLGLENLYREAVKTRLEGRRPVADMGGVAKARQILTDGGADIALAVVYLQEVVGDVAPTEPAVDSLNELLVRAMESEDPTSDVDPRISGALQALKASAEAAEHVGELRMRLAACQLFTALLEAGFSPENNWDEAVDSDERSQDLAHIATNGQRDRLADMFRAFAELPEEVRMRRLAYLAEATAHIESMVTGTPAT